MFEVYVFQFKADGSMQQAGRLEFETRADAELAALSAARLGMANCNENSRNLFTLKADVPDLASQTIHCVSQGVPITEEVLGAIVIDAIETITLEVGETTLRLTREQSKTFCELLASNDITAVKAEDGTITVTDARAV